MNILTKFYYKIQYGSFSQIKVEDYLPAIKQGITLAKAEIDSIVNNPEVNFKNNSLLRWTGMKAAHENAQRHPDNFLVYGIKRSG
jgi:Zn-dependent oligopeptidase